MPVEERWRVSPLEWDSEFWGCRVGRLLAGSGSCDVAAIEVAIGDSFDFVYLLSFGDRLDQIQVAEHFGFRTVDIRYEVSLVTASSAPEPADVEIRSPTIPEFEAAISISREAHGRTRFGEDVFVAPQRVAEFYQTWLRRDHALPDWTTLVALVNGDVVGYITHGPTSNDAATIGLIAVRPDQRGRGIGTQLLRATSRQQFELGRPRIEAVTQGGSEAAVAMYQRAGFKTGRVGIWLHWHRGHAQ